MGEKLNTAEFDKKGRCIRHPAIRLRKKKMFGGWKIIIGHCPECCLEEMRRVRDEIGAENSNDSDYDNDESPRRRSRKSKDKDRDRRKSDKKKKKRRDRDRSNRGDRDRSNRHNVRNEDSFSHSEDIICNTGEGHHHSSSQYMSHNGSSMYSLQDNNNNNNKPRRLDQHVGHPQHKQQQLNNNIDDQPSVGTGSTAMNSSMDGTVNSNMSPRLGYPHTGHGGPAGSGGYQQYQINRNQPSQAANNNNYHRHINQSPDNFPSPPKPPPPPRTMVLSMAFTDPQTGQRGTYTGQVNSINHKPDGKGTVYYANGNIAEGSWSNGILLDDSSGDEDDDDEFSGSQHSNNMGNSPSNSQNSRGRNTAPLRGGEEQFVRSASRGGEGYYPPERNNGSRSSSRQGSKGVHNRQERFY